MGTGAVKYIKDEPSWPMKNEDQEDSSVMKSVKRIGIFLAALSATVAVLTGGVRCYNGWVINVKDEARAEVHSTQIQRRVESVETKIVDLDKKVDKISDSQRLDQLRSARIEALVEMLLRVQGKTPPPKSDELTAALRQSGEY